MVMDKLNFKHLFFIICATTIPALKTYPQIYMRHAKKESWISVAIAGIIIILYFNYIIKVCVRNKCFSLYEIYTYAIGKLLGRIFLILFLITLFLSLLGSASLETSVIHYNLFVESPNWYIALFIVLPGLYSVLKGKNSVIIVIMVSIVISVINGINLYMLTYRFKEYRRLFPVFEKGISLDFFIGTAKALGLYASAVIALPYLAQIKEKERIRRCAIFTLIFVVQMIIVSTDGILTTFSIERANIIIFPKLIQTQLISYFGFIASGEFYVIFQVISGWFAKYVATFFGILLILKELKIEKICNIRFLPYTISALVYIGTLCTANSLIGLFKFLEFYDFICLINFFIIPTIIFIIYSFRVKAYEKKS
jgi:spore germination protein (amino acid permease)